MVFHGQLEGVFDNLRDHYLLSEVLFNKDDEARTMLSYDNSSKVLLLYMDNGEEHLQVSDKKYLVSLDSYSSIDHNKGIKVKISSLRENLIFLSDEPVFTYLSLFLKKSNNLTAFFPPNSLLANYGLEKIVKELIKRD